MSIQWAEKFATGMEIVDNQHKRLFKAIAELESHIQQETPKGSETDKLIEFLGNYAVLHFNFEEGCMSDFSCPSAEENKAAHKEFLDYYTKFKAEYDATDEITSLLKDLQSYTENWLEGHICNIDSHLKNCVTTTQKSEQI